MAYTTINKSSDYFTPNLHTGTGSARNITGIGFQPDFTIVKRRESSGVWYNTDIVRGAGKQMYLNESGGMGGSASTTEITGFNSDGFNLGTDGGVNASSGTYVSYNFLANNTTGSSNTNGAITSTVSANTTSGFSIVKWNGTGSTSTIGHGLSTAPSMIITKSLGGSSAWGVYNESMGNTKIVFLNESGSSGTNAAYWNNTSPTSSVFTVGSDAAVNHSGNAMIAYCFADVQGYSKFGSYTGNGNNSGSFIYTGFKPAFFLVKRYSAAETWLMYDNKRLGYNDYNNFMSPDSANGASIGHDGNGAIDILSNGIKPRGTSNGLNNSGSTYIYMAFAEAPLVGTNNVPANAR